MSTVPPVVLAWRNVHLLDDAVRKMLDKRLVAEVGCSLLEHDLLAWLTAAPSGRLQMLDLADRLGVTRGGLTRIVDRLVDRGWIERERPADNRREAYAVLTSSGRQAARRARASYVGLLRGTVGVHLADDELDVLARLTGKLLGAVTGRSLPEG